MRTQAVDPRLDHHAGHDRRDVAGARGAPGSQTCSGMKPALVPKPISGEHEESAPAVRRCGAAAASERTSSRRSAVLPTANITQQRQRAVHG